VPGCYNRDHQGFLDYQRDSRTPAAFAAWLARWVALRGAPTPAGYLALLGPERAAALGIKDHALSAPVDYGY
jgi:hypothetical protein